MAKYFSGPSTPQMRLTVFLIGVAALAAAIYSSNHTVKVETVSGSGRPVAVDCGSAFEPRPPRSFLPELAESCAASIGMWPFVAWLLYATAALFLIRFLYMMIGPKAHSG